MNKTTAKIMVASLLTGVMVGSVPNAVMRTNDVLKIHDTGLYSTEHQFTRDLRDNTGWNTGHMPDSELAGTGKKACDILRRDRPEDYQGYLAKITGGHNSMRRTMDVYFHTAVPHFCPDQLDTINQKG